jgi:hypothetical protein
MKKQIYFIILLLTCKICNAQNLVPNGDFEQYSGCPDYLYQFDSVLFWTNPTLYPGGGGSPDYFNSCTNSAAGVPSNGGGYQYAHSGVGYCGILAIVPSNVNYREYIEAALTSPLISNQCYQFSMYVSLGDRSSYATDDIQVYFSNVLISGITNHYPLPFVPQLSNSTGIINDTLNWTLITGTYLATGGESHLIIGNFLNDSNTTTQPTNFGIITGSYYFIDDVSLSVCTGIEVQNANYIINISPNPFSNKLNVQINNNEISEIILYDMASKKLVQQRFINSGSLNTEQLAKGLYLYEVRDKNGFYKKGKIVKD